MDVGFFFFFKLKLVWDSSAVVGADNQSWGRGGAWVAHGVFLAQECPLLLLQGSAVFFNKWPIFTAVDAV